MCQQMKDCLFLHFKTSTFSENITQEIYLILLSTFLLLSMLFQVQIEDGKKERKKKKEQKRDLYSLIPRTISLFAFLDTSFGFHQGPRSYERQTLSWDAQYQLGLDEIESTIRKISMTFLI